MSLPLIALTDEEVSHYAAFDKDAAEELARRNTRYSAGYITQIENLKRELSERESEIERLEEDAGDYENQWCAMEEACALIRKAMAAEDQSDTETYLQQALEELGQ